MLLLQDQQLLDSDSCLGMHTQLNEELSGYIMHGRLPGAVATYLLLHHLAKALRGLCLANIGDSRTSRFSLAMPLSLGLEMCSLVAATVARATIFWSGAGVAA